MERFEFMKNFELQSKEVIARNILLLLKNERVLLTSSAALVAYFYLRKKNPKKLIIKEPLYDDKEYNGTEIVQKTMPKRLILTSWFPMWLLRVLLKTPLRGILSSFLKERYHFTDLNEIIITDLPTFKPIILPNEKVLATPPVSDIDLWSHITKKQSNEGFEFVTISSILEAYRNGSTTPLNVARRVIAILKEMGNDGKELNAIVEYDENTIIELAESSTKRWKAKKPLSVFDGIPVAIKDQIYLSGHHARFGTEYTLFNEPKKDSDEDGMVKKLREGGAIFIGMANMHPLGAGVTGVNKSKFHGTALNPYTLKHFSGGSSGGSAATIAAGLCPLALGTDSAGSIRIPAACCGVVGLKGTYDRFPVKGLSMGARMVGHSGPLAATVRDAAVAYGFLANKDESLTVNPHVSLHNIEHAECNDLKIGVDWEWINSSNKEIKDGCIKAINVIKENLCAKIVEVKLPEKQEFYNAFWITIVSEFAYGSKIFLKRQDKLMLDYLLFCGITFSSTDLIQASKQKTRTINALKYMFSNVDLLLTPSYWEFQPVVEPSMKINGYLDNEFLLSTSMMSILGNFTGVPAMTLPVDYSNDNLPISVQLIAPWWREDLLLRVGLGLERFVTKKRPSYYFNILE